MKLIDADKIHKKLWKKIFNAVNKKDGTTAEQAFEVFKNAPAVEIVRCKDCKHYEIHKPSVTLNCEREGRIYPMMPNDFCSYGEKGADNEQG